MKLSLPIAIRLALRRYWWAGLILALGILLVIISAGIEAPIPRPTAAIAAERTGYLAAQTVNPSAVWGDFPPVLAQAEPAPTWLDEGDLPADNQGAARQAFRRAVNRANQAATLAQGATTAQQWDRVAESWLAAIAQLLSIPPKSPQRVFAQRKIREYLENLAIAQRYGDLSSFPLVEPSFGSPSLNEQLALYQSYIATLGVPNVLIIGSSRSLQGVDPNVLQATLAAQGIEQPRVYNFGIYGATAQVIAAVVETILPPEQLPNLILWPEGSRAFNEGRPDITFNAIAASPGYQQLAQASSEATPKFTTPDSVLQTRPQTLMNANANGFVAIAAQFDPNRYYQTHPRVTGAYDADYDNFALNGAQAQSLQRLATFAQAQGKTLVYVNLPLTPEYLDATRQRHEATYQAWLRSQSAAYQFQFIDLMEPGLQAPQYFADPSHINRYGAAMVAQRLGTHPDMPWSVLQEAPRESAGDQPLADKVKS